MADLNSLLYVRPRGTLTRLYHILDSIHLEQRELFKSISTVHKLHTWTQNGFVVDTTQGTLRACPPGSADFHTVLNVSSVGRSKNSVGKNRALESPKYTSVRLLRGDPTCTASFLERKSVTNRHSSTQAE